jgi:threonine dehydrogenase-like Zn-dependent dehydrogenase
MASVLMPHSGGRPNAAPIPVGSVAVVGLGYVGLPTALALAESGRSVVGVDISEGRILAPVAKLEEQTRFLPATGHLPRPRQSKV